jgi:hypothetical protein
MNVFTNLIEKHKLNLTQVSDLLTKNMGIKVSVKQIGMWMKTDTVPDWAVKILKNEVKNLKMGEKDRNNILDFLEKNGLDMGGSASLITQIVRFPVGEHNIRTWINEGFAPEWALNALKQALKLKLKPHAIVVDKNDYFIELKKIMARNHWKAADVVTVIKQQQPLKEVTLRTVFAWLTVRESENSRKVPRWAIDFLKEWEDERNQTQS